MKKMILAGIALTMITATACNKKTDDPAPAKTATPANTNALEGNWVLKTYDGMDVTAPMAGTYKTKATSATDGTASFDLTFDGSKHDTEEDTYTMSSSNTKVTFTKTGGTIKTLSGGGTWTIDTLNSSLLRMTSQYGLIIRMTK